MEFQKLKAVMDTLPEYGIPGCDAIAMKDHKVIFRYSAGLADTETGKKLNGDELFYMYSCTKFSDTMYFSGAASDGGYIKVYGKK